MPNTTSPASPTLLAILLSASGLVAGCASSSSAAKSTGPVEIDGATYKLVVAGGQMDGRTVEFIRKGDTAIGCLVNQGNRLRNVTGADPGTWVFQLRDKGAGAGWEGAYRNISPDGNIIEREVVVFFEGDNLSWNLESATWERQSGGDKMDEATKQKCIAR